MDELDCRILDLIQNDFPLSERPYEVFADKLQISVEQLWQRLGNFISQGIIRRIGASLDSYKLGFSSTLTAISVEAERVEQAAQIINGFSEVTHSYLRKDDFNIWFTVIATDEERIKEILEQIRSSLSLQDSHMLNLPMKRLFKLDVRFNVSP